MGYSDDLDKAIKNGLAELIELYENGSSLFATEPNLKYYEEYLKVKKDSNK